VHSIAECEALRIEPVEIPRVSRMPEPHQPLPAFAYARRPLHAPAQSRASRLSALEEAVAKERDQRKELVKVVPPVLYRRYEMVRKRRGSAVAYTYGGTCSACHMAINPMMFQKLRRGEDFDQCPSCQRILYFRTEPLPEDQEAEGASGDSQGSESTA